MKKVLLLLLVPAFLAAGAVAQDEGDDQYKRWRLDVSVEKPANIVLKSATGARQVHWYVLYTLTNNSEEEIPLEVAVAAVDDDDRTYRDCVAPLAQKAIEKKVGKELKNSLDVCRGKIGPGESIAAVALLGEVDAGWDWLHVRFSGLMDPLDRVDGKIYYEKQILVSSYYRPGDEHKSLSDAIHFKGRKWEILGERKEVPQSPRE